MKRRWNDDVVFKNQARGTEDKGKKEFVNVSLFAAPFVHVHFKCFFFFLSFPLGCFISLIPTSQDLLRSDFHRRFMSKYVR